MKRLGVLSAVANGLLALAASSSGCETVEKNDLAYHLPEVASRSGTDIEIEKLEKIAGERPRDPEPHYQIAAVHFREAEYREAAVSLEHAIDIGGEENPRYHYQLGRVYLNLRERRKALEHFRRAVENTREERYSGPRAALAYVLALEKRVDEALRHFRRCIEIEPENPEFYYFTGALYDMKHDDENAIRYFREYLDHGGRRYRTRAINLLGHLGVLVEPAARTPESESGGFAPAIEGGATASSRSEFPVLLDDLPPSIADEIPEPGTE